MVDLYPSSHPYTHTNTSSSAASSSASEEAMNPETLYYKHLQNELSSLHQNPFTFLLFGASGHLARTQILPSLYKLYIRQLLPPDTVIIGYSRSHYNDISFRQYIYPYLE